MPKEEEDVMGMGLHITMVEHHLKEDETIAKLVVSIFPMPAGALVHELGEHLKNAAHAFFVAKEMVTEEAIDLTPKGPIQ